MSALLLQDPTLPPMDQLSSWTTPHAGSSLPENSDCLAFSKTALHTSALRNDIHDLLLAYKEKDSLDFTPFSSLWKSRQFSLIHFACNDAQSREVFVSGLYQVLFDYLSSEETLSVQAGAVFGLYLVYFTQPTSLKKVPIRLTTSVWHKVETVYKHAFGQKATDLIYIIRKLRESSAFVYMAQQEPVGRPFMANNEFVADQLEKRLIQAESAMQSNVLVPIEPLLSDMSSLAAEYRKAKAGLVSLALARRSSEIVMGQLLRVKPAGMNVKDAKPLPHFLEKQSALGAASRPSIPSPAAGTAAGMSTVPTTIPSDDSSDSDMEIDGQSASKPALASSSTSSAPTGFSGETSTAESRVSSSVTGAVAGAGAKSGAETVSAVAGPSNVSTQVHTPRFIRRAGGKGIELTLPSAFPLSMLQSTAFSISTKTEDIVRDYYKHRHLRYEYTGSGGLTMNNNEYPEQFLLVNRTRKRELEKKRRVEEKREKRSEKSKRRYMEMTHKLRGKESSASSAREEEEEEEGDGESTSARIEQDGQEKRDSHGQGKDQDDQGDSNTHGPDQGQAGEEDNAMEEVIGEPQDQHMLEATDGEEAQPDERRDIVEAGGKGEPHHQGHVVPLAVDSVMDEEHADGSAILAGIGPQEIEGAESLLGLLKQGLP